MSKFSLGDFKFTIGGAEFEGVSTEDVSIRSPQPYPQAPAIAAYIVMASDRPLMDGATYYGMPLFSVSLASARAAIRVMRRDLQSEGPARLRFAAIKHPQDLVDWAEAKGARIMLGSFGVETAKR
jgi:hypothetical protein